MARECIELPVYHPGVSLFISKGSETRFLAFCITECDKRKEIAKLNAWLTDDVLCSSNCGITSTRTNSPTRSSNARPTATKCSSELSFKFEYQWHFYRSPTVNFVVFTLHVLMSLTVKTFLKTLQKAWRKLQSSLLWLMLFFPNYFLKYIDINI